MTFASSEHHPNRNLKLSVSLLVILLLAYAACFTRQSWRKAESEQSTRLAMICDLSGNAIDTYLSQLEIGLRNLGMDLTGTGSKTDLDRAYTQVSRFQKLHAELGNIILIRADGQVLLTGKIPNRRDLPTLANDVQFQKFRDELLRGSSFAIGQPVIGNIDKNWVVAARLAVTDQAGKLIYILSANLPTDMMQRFWGDPQFTGITATGLVRDDGYVVNRHPEPDAASMDQVYGKPLTGAMFDYLRSNNFPPQGHTEDAAGTAPVRYAIRRLKHYPLTLFVEMPAAEIRAAWWNRVRAPSILMVLMLAGIFAFFVLSLRRRRIWSMAHRREVHRLAYEHALQERSPNEIYMFDANTLQLTYANDYALDNLGYTLEQLQTKNLLSLLPELGLETFSTLIEPLRRGKQESIKYRTTEARADGSTYPVEVNLQLIASDEGGGFLAIINDIAALTQAEENIRKFNAPVERRGIDRNLR